MLPNIPLDKQILWELKIGINTWQMMIYTWYSCYFLFWWDILYKYLEKCVVTWFLTYKTTSEVLKWKQERKRSWGAENDKKNKNMKSDD